MNKNRIEVELLDRLGPNKVTNYQTTNTIKEVQEVRLRELSSVVEEDPDQI